MRINYNSQNGIISLFVLFITLILLVFVIAIYYSVRAEAKLQARKELEYQEIYSKNYEEISNVDYATETEIIPIYNIDELNIAGTNSYIQIKNKIYQCGREKSYILKDNIIVDINEKIKTKSVDFNDYKLYSSTYLLDKASYDLYYYIDNRYWKLVCYKKYEDGNYEIKNKAYTEKEFTILDDLVFNQSGSYDFYAVWTDENNEFINEYYDTQKINSSKISNLNIYESIKDELGSKGEFYIFISIG
jgi:hypothetical protein